MTEALRRSQPTFCRICEVACGLVADLDAHGQPLRLRPDRQHPVSQGFVCAKGTRFVEVARHPQRVLWPLCRHDDGSYQRTTWPQAMALLTERLGTILQRYGPHAIGIYFGNPLAFNTFGALTMLGFMRALGSRHVFSAGSQDCNNKFAGSQIVHGSPFIHPLPDFEHTDLALLLGTNPAVSQSSFVHLQGGSTVFDRLAQRGGRMLWVDPRYTESAQRWGEHVPIRPGTDIFLLLALLHLLRQRYRPERYEQGLERLLELAAVYPPEVAAALTGIAVQRIEAIGNAIAAARRATFHMSVGVNQGPFGTLCYVALQALAYLSGHFDQRGGVLFHPLAVWMSNLAQYFGVGITTEPGPLGELPGILGTLPGGILAEAIERDGPERIRALLVVAGDPLTSMPGEPQLRQALHRLDLLACLDLFQNTTGREAHVILPTTSWLERWDVATTTAMFQHTAMLQYSAPVCKAPPEVRSEAAILTDLSLALGRPLYHRRLFTHLWRWLTWDAGMAALTTLAWWPARWLFGGAQGIPLWRPQPQRYLGRGPRTPGQQVRFWHASLDAEPQRLAEHAALVRSPAIASGQQPRCTLLLLGRRRRLGHNSWLHGALPDGETEGVAWLASEDLQTLGMPAGGRLRVHSAGNTLEIPAVPRGEVMPGTMVLPHGVVTANINALIPTGKGCFEPVSGQHRMSGIAVDVEPATG